MGRLERIGVADFDAVVPQQVAVETDVARAAGAKGALPTTPARSGLLDLGWIRVNIPIVGVADKLGLKRRGKSALCCFHNDRTPSLSFHRNRFRCHALSCGRRGNVLDLIVGFFGCDLRGALNWLLAQGYEIPMRDPEARRRWKLGRAGVGGVGIDAVAQSGLLGQLAKPAALILSTLCGLADPTTGQVEMSYAGLMKRSGIQNRGRMSGGLQALRRLGLLEWRRGRSPGGFRTPSLYALSVDASTCQLAVEKLQDAFDGAPVGTVNSRRSSDGGTAVLTLGKARSDLFKKSKSAEPCRREGGQDRTAPNAQKSARPVEKEAASRRRVRHPGFGDWRRLP